MAIYYDYSYSYISNQETATPAPTTAPSESPTVAPSPPAVTVSTTADRDDKSPLNLLSHAASAVTDESVSSVSSAPPGRPESNETDASPNHTRPPVMAPFLTVSASISQGPNPPQAPGSPALGGPPQARTLQIPPPPPVIIAPPATAPVTKLEAPIPPTRYEARPPPSIPPPPTTTGPPLPLPPKSIPSVPSQPSTRPTASLPPYPIPNHSSVLAVFPQYPTSASAFSIPMTAGMEIMLPATHPHSSGTISGAPFDHNGGDVLHKVPAPTPTQPTGEKVASAIKAKGNNRKRVKYKLQYHYVSMKRWEAHRYIEALAQGAAPPLHHHPSSPWTGFSARGAVLDGHRFPGAVPVRAVRPMGPIHRPHHPPAASSSVMVPY